MDIETSSKKHGHQRVFVSWERTDFIQITNITFCYNRVSILTDDSLKSMGRYKIQLLLEDNTWSTKFEIPKKDRYGNPSTDWTLVNIKFTETKHGIKLKFIQIDTAHADLLL